MSRKLSGGKLFTVEIFASFKTIKPCLNANVLSLKSYLDE